ncbi:undecaprenyldiphospho-muramoylpentapeptide beta-N-acetylglucosaminyltransferase [Pseudomarimonas salicorniae]|uniref:UDP-N-acetylglucosamine--N-acetylmuramyl-(pentapeptide) pyrophosphoryl-undecaprenol N-acetylglucosamine transferase n=1 Tax=Pseudomarimonas salicorniae TaxID=2933270 RepID=A0ABT0GHE6_9GAMM|nr:undecaprenyldiphospho-muramoylpentapeptide beta-N-acetylglucosaminyltransferase [Lysobacter sp. CAU 1642]MCK7593959.1 undecaprenyldiphospho-muramoylpentapeptide beta-N-acetylglucosaminyltransferase [Lysobacter sp. CAU 1642]
MAPVLIMAGGTGGHIFPGLALAAELRARDVPVLWLGAEGGLETRLVPEHGVEIATLPVRGLRGKGMRTLLTAPLMLARSLFAAIRLMGRTRPRSAISFGGYAAGPGGLAAWLLRVPLCVHEQNRVPGLTNRWLAKLARRVLCGFPGAFPRSPKLEVVGNPVRAEIAALPAPTERFAGREGPLRLLVLGGSQGARALNAAVPRALAGLEAGWTVRHQCGEKMVETARKAYSEAEVEAQVEPFIKDMAEAYGWADLVVCRAGALTIAELASAGVGALLVPFPHAVDDHQTLNAGYLVEAGAAHLLVEGEGLDDRLAAAMSRLSDRSGLAELAVRARALAHRDAAVRVAEAVLSEARP